MHRRSGSPGRGPGPAPSRLAVWASPKIHRAVWSWSWLEQPPIRVEGLGPALLRADCSSQTLSAKQARRLKRHLIPQDVITGPGQLVGHRLQGQGLVLLAGLP